MDKPKRKGGAEKDRDRKKRRMLDEASKCQSLDIFFKTNKATSTSTQRDDTTLVDVELTTATAIQEEKERVVNSQQQASTSFADAGSTIQTTQAVSHEIPDEKCSNQFDVSVNLVDVVESDDSEHGLGIRLSENNFFRRPLNDELKHFFEYHPQVPTNQSETPFVISKVFNRDTSTPSQRKWLSYSTRQEALYCCVCLAFSGYYEKNVFAEGMSDWRHVHQRINEHETSNQHSRCVESYFRFMANKTIDKCFYSGEVLEKKQSKISQNRQVVHRVIETIKLIGKRGLSYRGKRNEAAYTLDDESKDHGTFLEIILLLSKYDIVLKNHSDNVIERSKQYKAKGMKGRAGNFITFISKTTLNLIIKIITANIKEIICEQIKHSGMFSLEIDTTQDISVKDQCSVVIRYVYEGQVFERLLAVVSCHDTTGQGFDNIVQKVLKENGLDANLCIADSTDGAANMQGKYNGFTTKMQEQNKEHVHIWC